MEVGLCLSGGGVKGAAHIGVLKAFEEENINFNFISGTSSGSIVAALYSCGYNSSEIYNIFKQYEKNIKYIDFKNIFKAVYGIIFKRKIIIDGLNSGEVIEKIMKEACLKKEIQNINQVKKALLIPSVSLKDGSVYIFCSKEMRNTYSNTIKYDSTIEIGKAVRASCSYPGVFSPCKYKDTELTDGGIRENIPWKETKKAGANKVISVVFEKNVKQECCNNIIDVVSRAIDIMNYELFEYETEGVDYLLKVKSRDIHLLDTSKIDELYDLGYNQAKENMKNIKNIIFEDN